MGERLLSRHTRIQLNQNKLRWWGGTANTLLPYPPELLFLKLNSSKEANRRSNLGAQRANSENETRHREGEYVKLIEPERGVRSDGGSLTKCNQIAVDIYYQFNFSLVQYKRRWIRKKRENCSSSCESYSLYELHGEGIL